MADVTVLTKIYEFVHSPYMEVVQIEASEGEEYKSVKFKTILGATLTLNEDNDGYVIATHSGQTATIHSTSGADKTMTLVLYGRK